MSENLKERGETAALAYLERVGMMPMHVGFATKNGVIPIVALDEHALVHVVVRVHKNSKPISSVSESTLRKYRRQMDEYITTQDVNPSEIRYDLVDILVIADDRALLRHHRNIGG